jgi:HSP20 family molecular chaperone IbpA
MGAESHWARIQRDLDAEEAQLLRRLRAVRRQLRSLSDTIELARGVDAENAAGKCDHGLLECARCPLWAPKVAPEEAPKP